MSGFCNEIFYITWDESEGVICSNGPSGSSTYGLNNFLPVNNFIISKNFQGRGSNSKNPIVSP